MVEVAVAIVVVTLSFLGIFALTKQSMRLTSDLNTRCRAAQVVESEMERLRAIPPGASAEKVQSYILDPTTTPSLGELRGGSATVRVSAMPGEAAEMPLRVVSVRVKWVGTDGRARELVMSSLLPPGEVKP